MRVLGVDPGSLRTGWGLVEGSSASPRLVDSGIIRLPGSLGLPARLHRLRSEFERLVASAGSVEAAVETPFHGANARSALQLAHARGVILAVLAAAGVPVAEPTPAMVKKAVTGSGRASKEQVQAMVVRLLRLDVAGGNVEGDDRTDALAVALCHLCTEPFRAAVSSAERRSSPPR